jgi:DNA-binding GntR family transcriptional regulator
MNDLSHIKADSGEMVIARIGKIRTLREAIYFYLRDGIIKQQIKPNERLQEKMISEQLGVSPTPVREAFLKLQAEGYLDLDAHRGAKVKPISHSELIEIYQVMSALDGFAASLAIKRMDRHSLEELNKLTEKMGNFYKKNMIEEYLNFNTLIHSLIWKTAGNKHLKTTLDNIQNQMLRYHIERLSFYSKPGILQKSMRSHKKILKAFVESDQSNIERIVREHWDLFEEVSE